MKKTIFILILFIEIMTISCNSRREKSAEELLENTKIENEIYSAIISNKEHLSKFMNKMMMTNSSAMNMICTSEKMMDSLINNNPQIIKDLSNSLIKKMGTDSAVCDKTCTKMIENENVRRYIENNMKMNQKHKI